MKLITSLAAAALMSGSANAALTSQLGVLDLDANGGLNPSTGLSWQAGDTYRLVFISSTLTAAPTSTDIGTYNAEVDALATATGYGSVDWFAIGSTATVDARDNTGTNPSSTGVGIFLMDGTQVIANNNAQLWSAVGNTPGLLTSIDLDENGDAFRTDTPWAGHGAVWTGSANDGTGAANGQLGSTGNVTLGLASQTNGHWITRSTAADTVTNQMLYGMSDTLTVVPEPSTTALLGLGGLALILRRHK